ncbi:T9SS type A sorting domain-containing protein [Chryseobacterium sp. 2987]|uniref:T9SS type A sorting domain-containing protein n=1 Tax=Chryseobacterium sp. 2987 TaxID=2817767 RepID=UPI00285A9A88|nr:T9SS type A sorting domain-containing protein [Chryseobacterium sp. 2987]MDR6920541.1 hypothetical protein [Chryseobacterium sp. 2987]
MKRILLWGMLLISITMNARVETGNFSTDKKEYNGRNKAWNPPANDDCENAVQLTVNSNLNCGVTVAGTTLDATDSGLAPAPCYGTADDDVWYKFTATASIHVISLKNIVSVGSDNSTDMYFQVFNGTCGNLTSIKCSDPEENIVRDLTPGETYYIRVYSYYGAGRAQTFNICVGMLPPPVANDECSGAVTLTVNADLFCGNKTSGTTIGGTDSGIDPCEGESDDDVWYKFTAVETSHAISLSNVDSIYGYDSPMFEIFSGSCGALTSIGCSDYETSQILTGLNPGETYYIRIFSDAEGFNTFDICIGTLPDAPPANDECSGAVALTVNSDMSCSNKISGHTAEATDSGIDPCDGEADDDVWYKFTAVGTSHIVSISNVAAVSGYGGAFFEVFSGACDTLTNIVCSDYEDYQVLSGLTPGETYYIRVFSMYDGAITFDLCVGTLPPAPANDACSGALSATVFPYSYTQADAAGATNNDGFIESCTDEGMNDGTWFTFTGTGSTFDISVTMPSGSSFDPKIGVYSGSCDNLTCVGTADDGLSGGAEAISVQTTAGTVYYVNVGNYSAYSDNMEGEFTIAIKNASLGTSEVSKEKDKIKVYPNPFTDVLNIADISKVGSITISDVSGRQVKNINVPSSVLHLEDLKQGMYLVILNMKDGSKQTVKVIRK